MKAVGFDLGDTLVEYEGIPLSWINYYPVALTAVAGSIGIIANGTQIERGSEVLKRYNTRLNPRIKEVHFVSILTELLDVFDYKGTVDCSECARAFFAPFRQCLRAFPDTKSTLQFLRRRGLAIGVFTDVPYGMPTELVNEDLAKIEMTELCDLVLTSGEVGVRKPASQTLAELASRLKVSHLEMIYIGNEKKDIEAALAYGCDSVLLDRTASGADYGQSRTIRSLAELW